jgi:hypothetical protein
MKTGVDSIAELIGELLEALRHERRALLSGTAAAINSATQHKMLIADLIEEATVAGAAPPNPDVLRPLVRYNQENAVICTAMLQHLIGAIDRLRAQDPHRSYSADGSERKQSAQHALGAA